MSLQATRKTFRDAASVERWYTSQYRSNNHIQISFNHCHFYPDALVSFSYMNIQTGRLVLSNCEFHGDPSLLFKMIRSRLSDIEIKGCTGLDWSQVGSLINQAAPYKLQLSTLSADALTSIMSGLNTLKLTIRECTLPPALTGHMTKIEFIECVFPDQITLEGLITSDVTLNDCSGDGLVEVSKWLSQNQSLTDLTLSYQGNWVDLILSELHDAKWRDQIIRSGRFNLCLDRCTLTPTTYAHLKRILRPLAKQTKHRYLLSIQYATIIPTELTQFLKSIQFYNQTSLRELSYFAGHQVREDIDVVIWFNDRQRANTDFIHTFGQSNLPEDMKGQLYMRVVGPFPKDLIHPLPPVEELVADDFDLDNAIIDFHL